MLNTTSGFTFKHKLVPWVDQYFLRNYRNVINTHVIQRIKMIEIK